MQITSVHTIVLRAVITIAVVLMLPTYAFGYGYGYGEGLYYGQVTYYGQSPYYGYGYGQTTYATTIIGNVLERINFSVSGNISKASGSFVIDHPVDPKHKLLYHSFVESPDVKNFYDGIVTMNAGGEATVQLPAYFDALNTDVRYQLKPIGSPMPNLYIKNEEKNNQFTIAGGVSGGRVSWQITGTRHDPYILANPIVPEVEKGPTQLVGKGEYLYPDAYPTPPFNYALPPHWLPGTQNSR